jgi:hypothetical protein
MAAQVVDSVVKKEAAEYNPADEKGSLHKCDLKRMCSIFDSRTGGGCCLL